MNKLIKALCLAIVLSVCVFAQTDSDEYKKNEYYVGYSFQKPTGEGNSGGLDGFEFSYVRNVRRFIGIKADVSGAHRSKEFNFNVQDQLGNNFSFKLDNGRKIYNFLGGIQIKDNASKARFKPFGHALAGVAVNTFSTKNLVCVSGNCPSSITNTPNFTFTRTNFSGAFGGGLDIKINDRFDFRAIQIDYNPIFSNNRVENNFRFGIGIVIK